MAIKEIFFDLSLGSGGNGTYSDPFGSLRGFNWSNDLRLRFRRGRIHKLPSRWGGISVPKTIQGGLEITDYGDSEERATLDGSVAYTNWQRSSGDIWFTSGVPLNAGVIMENGLPLTWTDWRGGKSTALSKMKAGSYAFDFNNGVAYVWLRNSGNPNDAGYSIEIATTSIGIYASGNATTKFSDLQVNNIRIIGCARQGSNLENVLNAEYINNVVQYTGGAWSKIYYLGGGLQCAGGCRNILYERNVVTDTYDSPISPQLYTDNTHIDGVIIRRNVLGNFALGGVEVAIWSNGCTTNNVLIEDNRIFGGGRGWSGTGDNNNNTEGVIINGRPYFTNIRVVSNVIEDIDHCGIEVRNAQSNSISLLRNRISRCRIGIRNFAGVQIDQKVEASYNEISRCSEYGILHDQRVGKLACIYRKNTLVNNGKANLALLRVNQNVPIVRDNNSYGAEYGIQRTGSLNAKVSFNNAFAASTQNYSGVVVGVNNYSVDPMLKNHTYGNYQLKSTSPIIGKASGTSGGRDLIGHLYLTDDIGCHASLDASGLLSNRADLKLLTQ